MLCFPSPKGSKAIPKRGAKFSKWLFVKAAGTPGSPKKNIPAGAVGNTVLC